MLRRAAPTARPAKRVPSRVAQRTQTGPFAASRRPGVRKAGSETIENIKDLQIHSWSGGLKKTGKSLWEEL